MKLLILISLFVIFACQKQENSIKKQLSSTKLNTELISKEYNVKLQKMFIKENFSLESYEEKLLSYTTIKTLIESRNPLYRNHDKSFNKFFYEVDPHGLFLSAADLNQITKNIHLLEKKFQHPPLLFISEVHQLLLVRSSQFKKNTDLFLKEPINLNKKASFYIGKNKPLAINELSLIHNFDTYLHTLVAKIISEDPDLSTKNSELKIKVKETIDRLTKNIKDLTFPELINLYFNSMLGTTDQFSQYISPENYDYLQKNTQKDYQYKVISDSIGYLKIPYFYYSKDEKEKLSHKISLLIPEINKNSALIIDLRDNPGGVRDEAIELLNLFCPNSPLFIEKSKHEEKIVFSKKYNNSFKGKVLILINSQSASASELFAGAMQDNAKAILVGSKTAGKGTIQDLINLNQFSSYKKDLGKIKLTSYTFHRLDGSIVSNYGVQPDIELIYDKLTPVTLDPIKSVVTTIKVKATPSPDFKHLKNSSLKRQMEINSIQELMDTTLKINKILSNKNWLISDPEALSVDKNNLKYLFEKRKNLMKVDHDVDLSVKEAISILKEWRE